MTDITHPLRFADIRELRTAADMAGLSQEFAALLAEIDRLRRDNENHRASVHSCHPACTRAGCVNARLWDALTTLCNRIELEGATPLDWPAFKAARDALGE